MDVSSSSPFSYGAGWDATVNNNNKTTCFISTSESTSSSSSTVEIKIPQQKTQQKVVVLKEDRRVSLIDKLSAYPVAQQIIGGLGMAGCVAVGVLGGPIVLLFTGAKSFKKFEITTGKHFRNHLVRFIPVVATVIYARKTINDFKDATRPDLWDRLCIYPIIQQMVGTSGILISIAGIAMNILAIGRVNTAKFVHYLCHRRYYRLASLSSRNFNDSTINRLNELKGVCKANLAFWATLLGKSIVRTLPAIGSIYSYITCKQYEKRFPDNTNNIEQPVSKAS